MKFEKRLRALESKIYVADSSTRQISGRSGFLLTLLTDACRADLSPPEIETLKLIRESVSAPGTGRRAHGGANCVNARTGPRTQTNTGGVNDQPVQMGHFAALVSALVVMHHWI